MRRSSIMVAAVAVVLGAAGCHHGSRYAVPAGDPNCPPTDGCATPGQCADDIVVQAPRQRYVVNTPAVAPAAPVAAPAVATQGVASVTQGVAGFPQGVAGVPGVGFQQQALGFGMQPGVGMAAGAAPFGAAGSGSSSTTVTTNQRTRIALTTTTIRIPLPWLRLMPITEAPETTIRISGTQTNQAQGFAGVGAMQMGFAGGSLAGAPGSFVQGQVVGPPVAQGVVGGQTVVGTQVVAGQGVQVQPGAALVADPNAITPERLQALTKKIEELEAASRAKEAAAKEAAPKKDAAPEPKEKMP